MWSKTYRSLVAAMCCTVVVKGLDRVEDILCLAVSEDTGVIGFKHMFIAYTSHLLQTYYVL